MHDVLSAAVECGAHYLVTFNLRDFPKHVLEPLKVQAIHPDDFSLICLEQAPESVFYAVRMQQAALRRPRPSLQELLGRLKVQGLTHTVERLKEQMQE
jgi:hypothetical protein